MRPTLSRPATWDLWPKLEPATEVPRAAPVAACKIPKAIVSKPQIDSGASVDGDQELRKWVGQWSKLLEQYLPVAPEFSGLSSMAAPALVRVLSLKAAATLRRHLPSWRLWLEFAQRHEWPIYEPPCADVLEFCQELLTRGRSASGAIWMSLAPWSLFRRWWAGLLGAIHCVAKWWQHGVSQIIGRSAGRHCLYP